MMDDDRPEAEAFEPLLRPADSRAEAFHGVREARRRRPQIQGVASIIAYAEHAIIAYATRKARRPVIVR